MHMHQPRSARALMQIIDILRDDQQFATPRRIEPRERDMRRIGDNSRQRGAACIIKPMDQSRIGGERMRRTYILDAVPLPQAARTAKRGNSTFGRNTSTGQDHKIVRVGH